MASGRRSTKPTRHPDARGSSGAGAAGGAVRSGARSPVLALGAVGAVPPGVGVVEGDELPYRPEALKTKQREPGRIG